jgi:predicted kinase
MTETLRQGGAVGLSRAAVDALDTMLAGRSEGTGVVLVCGFPASGKSTVTRYLADQLGAVVFDKDGLAPGLEESVMAELTGDPYDRDSAVYRRVVGPHIYQALVLNALRVGRQCPVILDAPFLEYVRTAAGLGVRLSDHISAQAAAPVPVTTVWVAARPEVIRARMTSRGEPRDQPKLDDWPAYLGSVLESGVLADARDVVDVLVAND